MDPIKEAFSKAKQDILNLQSQIESLKQEILSIKRTTQEALFNSTNQQTDKPTQIPTQRADLLLKTQENPTIQQIPFSKTLLYDLKSPDMESSTRNRGVPTNRQTNQQTDKHIGNQGVLEAPNIQKEDKISHIEHVSEVLNSLDNIKKDIRSKFKHLTGQEMAVFSGIYELEEKGFIVDYSLLASKLSLSESSIRDYAQRIIRKGVPLIKTKENNKKVLLNIDQNLKKIASLQTILALREL